MSVIKLNNIWEKYRIKFMNEGRVSWEEIWVLSDVSFNVNKGEVLGIIGHNGAGKTTLLKLIAGILMPDKGNVNIDGKVSVLMELGAGFNPEFTGKENIILNARMYDLDEHTSEQQTEKIIEFSDLGRFIDAPIKYYSQGMYMRLAFALAIFVEPDILLIDDILAVGDEQAQQNCVKKIFELKEMGKTIVVVSHDMGMVTRLCNRVILLEKGRIVKDGLPEKVIQHYLETVGDKKGIAVLEKDKLRIVFNNGRIGLSYDANLLTKGSGGCAVCLHPYTNSWLSSFNLSWQIQSVSADTIIAEGVSADRALSQTWKLQLSDNTVSWIVEMKEGAVTQTHIDLALLPQYKKWVTLEREEYFPSFAHRSNWQDLGLHNPSEVILGLTQEDETQAIPSVIFEIRGKENELRLFNTGYEQETRIIQTHFDKDKSFFAYVKFFTEKGKFVEYIQKARSVHLLQQKAEEEKRLLQQKAEEEMIRGQRTISAGNLSLYADVEHKAIQLFYKDKEVTKGQGLHVSFLVSKHWHDISSAQWQVAKEKDMLLLTFFWDSFYLAQTWKFAFKENSLLWLIDSSVDRPFYSEVLKFGLLLTDMYQSFFCGYQEASFPAEIAVWREIPLDDSHADIFGVRKTQELPAIIFKNNDNVSCVIQNSDINSSCRALQLAVPTDALKEKTFSFATELTLLDDETPIERYVQEKQQQLFLQQKAEEEKRLLQQKAEEERIRSQRTISAGNLSLYADVEHKAIQLFYKDKEVTKGKGLYTYFKIAQDWLTLHNAQWGIHKISENALTLKLYYQPFPVSQIWELSVNDTDTLNITIAFEVDAPIILTNQDTIIELKDEYTHWATAYEQGDLLVHQYINNNGPIRLKDSKVTKVMLTSRPHRHFLFEAVSDADRRILGIYKHKQENEEHTYVNFSLLIPKQRQTVSPGKYIYFEGKVVLGKEVTLQEQISAKSITLTEGNLQFLFDRGRGRIFWSKKELTIGLGVYTSVRSLGSWFDSYQADWQLIEKEKNKIRVRGCWPYLPLAQIWQIELTEKNRIHWQIDTDIYEILMLEIEQANIMLTSEYKTWVVPDVCKGEFLDEYTQDYDILPFRFWHGRPKKRQIGVVEKGLPWVKFQCNVEDDIFRAIIENTDYLYKARLLQFQKCNARHLTAKKYRYFEGVITIEPES